MTLEGTLIKIDEPTVNGNVYNKEVAEQIYNSIKSGNNLVLLDNGSISLSFENLIGKIIDAKLTEESLNIKVDLLENMPNAEVIKSFINGGQKMFSGIYGIGKSKLINGKKQIESYTYLYATILDKPVWENAEITIKN